MKNLKYLIIFIFFSLTSVVAQTQCYSFYNTKRSPLNKIDRNGLWQDMKGHYLVERLDEARLTHEQSIAIARIFANAFPVDSIKDDTLLRIQVVNNNTTRLASTPSGKTVISSILDNQISIQVDPNSNFINIIVLEKLFTQLLTDKKNLLKPHSLDITSKSMALTTEIFNPSWSALWSGKSLYVGGLISISAEPPEAFFASSTKAELKQQGFNLTNADLADTWIMRAPDAREESFFKFQYPSTERPKDNNRKNKFLIAVGSGPAHNPATLGASEANLIWLGDEQHGVLSNYLKDISKSNVNWKNFYRHSGFVQRLTANSFWIGRINTSNGLTKEGFSSLVTDPEIYRQIISPEYDQFLSTLFEDSKLSRSKESYLLATSRGCSQGCSICCSGGLSAFQFFSPQKMMDEIHKIDNYSKLSMNSEIDVFFVDSNFNNNANRIIEFAKLYTSTLLKHKFRFFIRHNTVNGFLLSEKNGFKNPNIELIKAYKTLGINEVMMGVDAVDNASILTLKSSRLKIAKTGSSTRPTYTFDELQVLMQAFESVSIRTRGFLLTNNPWVSDLDRLDSYYNLLLLWINNPHFSIDMRDRQNIQLKPFEGSPIGDAAKRSQRKIVNESRFIAEGPLGELDEQFDFFPFNQAKSESNVQETIRRFRASLNSIRQKSTTLWTMNNENLQSKQAIKLIIQKMIQRDLTLLPTLISNKNYPETLLLIEDINSFQQQHKEISPFDESEQKRLFEEISKDLYDSIRQEYGK